MTKEMFVKTLNFIKERKDKEYEICTYLNDEFPDTTIFPYTKYERMLVEILEDEFEYQFEGMTERSEWISYYIYDTDFGRAYSDIGGVKIGIGEDTIDISTPELLYDYLVSQKKLEKKK